MRPVLAFALCAFALPSVAIAQATAAAPGHEIGVRGGFMRLSTDFGAGNESINVLSLPGAHFFAPGGVHFTFFVSPQVALEPQLGYLRTSEDDDSQSQLLLVLQPNYFFTPGAERSGYVFGQLGFLRQAEEFTGGSESDSRTIFGAGLGYRRVHRRSFAMRYEVRFRQFTSAGNGSSEINEIGVLIGFGAVLNRAP